MHLSLHELRKKLGSYIGGLMFTPIWKFGEDSPFWRPGDTFVIWAKYMHSLGRNEHLGEPNLVWLKLFDIHL